MVLCADDPIQAKMLEDIGCVAVMPLASLIGFRHGHPQSLERAAGARCGEGAGAGGCRRGHRVRCGHRHGTGLRRRADEHRHRARQRSGEDGRGHEKGVEAGREAFLSGRMPKKFYTASPSSPTTGLISSLTLPIRLTCGALRRAVFHSGLRHERRNAAHPIRRAARLCRLTSQSIRSFVLRQGRMSDAQHRFLDEMMPKGGRGLSSGAHRPERGFRPSGAAVVEIGFGMGQSTAVIAQARPATTSSASRCMRRASAACAN